MALYLVLVEHPHLLMWTVIIGTGLFALMAPKI